MAKRLMTVDEVKGAWAIMPTPAKADASSWRSENTVDLDETARVVEQLIASGVNAILSLGTLGECSTLSWDEKAAFMRTIVETARGRIPVFGGTSSLSTRETVRQTREARSIGVDGVMVGPPMWCAPDVPTAVQFFRDLAEACPDTAICVYANTEAFRFEFPRPFWAQVSELPQVITAKYIGIGTLLPDINVSRKRIRFLPLDLDYYGAARLDRILHRVLDQRRGVRTQPGHASARRCGQGARHRRSERLGRGPQDHRHDRADLPDSVPERLIQGVLDV